MGLWDQIVDAMPWNQAKVKARQELEAELQAIAEDQPPAASAAEAMAEMKARNAKARKPASATEEPEPEAGNTALRDKWRATAKSGPDPRAVDDIKRNKGG